ncbi:MAG TPA: hypothetical protein VNW92_05135 [Polyangiaceae bacterium]|jgi:hypothetical protein|nr:hypothetical protein [Polyangiaceae bacterium]
MRPLLWFFALSIAIVIAVSALGVWLIALPTRAAAALNDWFAVVPLADTGIRRAAFRVVGVALLVGGVRYGMTGVWSAIRAVFN